MNEGTPARPADHVVVDWVHPSGPDETGCFCEAGLVGVVGDKLHREAVVVRGATGHSNWKYVGTEVQALLFFDGGITASNRHVPAGSADDVHSLHGARPRPAPNA